MNFLFITQLNIQKDIFEPLRKRDCQTYLSSILHEANLVWFKHSYQFGLKSAGYISNGLDFVNANEIIKYSELFNNDLELDEDGNLPLSQILKLCRDDDDDNKKRIIHKLLINEFNENEVSLISKSVVIMNQIN